MAGKNDTSMKRFLTYLILLLSIQHISTAQNKDLYDANVDRILDYISTLKKYPERYKDVREDMSKDENWTMMSEFADSCSTKTALCTFRDKVRYTGLNDTALQAEQLRGTIPTTTSIYRNGNDPNYKYSLHEIKIKSDCQVKSHLRNRSGRQLILIIPYDNTSISITPQITINGSAIDAKFNDMGHYEFIIDQNIGRSDKIEISITNNTGDNQSVIIVNHNSGN